MTNTYEPQKPTFHVYAVKGEGKRAIWIKIGAAFEHQDGKGFGIDLDALPINGRLVLREPKEIGGGDE